MEENVAIISPEGMGSAVINVINQDFGVFRAFKKGVAIKILTADTSCLLDDWPLENRDSDGFLKIDTSNVSLSTKEKKLKIEVDDKVVGALNLNQAPRYKLYVKIGDESANQEIQIDLVVADNLYTTFSIDNKLLEKKQKEEAAKLAREKEEAEAKALVAKKEEECRQKEEQDKLEREQREKERREKEALEREQREKEREQREKERREKEALEREQREKEREQRAKEEADVRLKEEQEKAAFENLQKEKETEVKTDASFATEETNAPVEKTVVNVNINNNADDKKSNKMLFIILAIILLLALAAGAYFFLFSGKDAEKDACSLDNNNLQSVLTACNYQKGDSNDKLIDLAVQGAKDGNNCDNVNRILISLGRSGDIRAAESLAHFFDANKDDTSKCFVKDKENAKYWYQKVVDLDSNNEDAKKALDEVSK